MMNVPKIICLILITGLNFILCAIPFEQDSLYNLFNIELRRNNDIFMNKSIIKRITNDTLLLNLAIKFSKPDYHFNNQYFTHNALSRIKDKNLIYEKLDSLKFDIILFKKFLLEQNENVYLKYLKSFTSRYNFTGLEISTLKYVLQRSDIAKILIPEIVQHQANLWYTVQSVSPDIIPEAVILKLLKDEKTKTNGIKNLIEYYKENYFDAFISTDFSSINNYADDEYKQILNELKLTEYSRNIKNTDNTKIKNLIKDEATAINRKAVLLTHINPNSIDIDFFISLPKELKVIAAYRIKDTKTMLQIFESKENQSQWDHIFINKINDVKKLKILAEMYKNNKCSLSYKTLMKIFVKIKDGNYVYNYITSNSYKNPKDRFFSDPLLFKDEDKNVQLLSINSQLYPEKNFGRSYSNLLFGLNKEENYRKIIFGEFSEKIKEDLVPMITSCSLLSDILISDLDNSIKSKCVNHPCMYNDSMLFEIALNPETDFRLSELIANKLNNAELNEALNKRYSNPKVRSEIIYNSTNKDTLEYYLYNDPDISVRRAAAYSFLANEELLKHYTKLREDYNKVIKSKENNESYLLRETINTIIIRFNNIDFLYKILNSEKDKNFIQKINSTIEIIKADEHPDKVAELIKKTKNNDLLIKIKDPKLKFKLFWEIDDEIFRSKIRSFNPGHEGRADFERFLKEVLEKEKSPKVRADALASLDAKNNFEYMREYFLKDTTELIRGRIIYNLYGLSTSLGKKVSSKHQNDLISFYNEIITMSGISSVLRNKIRVSYQDFMVRTVSDISDTDKLMQLLENESDPLRRANLTGMFIRMSRDYYRSRSGRKLADYYKMIDQLSVKILNKFDNADSNMVNTLSEYATEPEILKILFTKTLTDKNRLKIISKIKDDEFLNSVISADKDSAFMVTAMSGLTDQAKVTELLKKYSNNPGYLDILLWRCNDIAILENFISESKNEKHILIAELKLELATCDKNKILDEFFTNWQKQIKPLTEKEIENLSSLDRNVYELYNIFLERNKEYHDRKKYIVLPEEIKCMIDSTDKGNIDNKSIYKRKSKGYINCSVNAKPYSDKILYFEKLYKNVLEEFIQYCLIDHKKFDFLTFKQPDYVQEHIQFYEKKYRVMILNENIMVNEFELGLGFNFITSPSIGRISFNKDYSKAVVNSTLYEYYYERENGKWKLTNSSSNPPVF